MDDFCPLKPKRLWYQFSLRTLLLIVVGVAISMAWIAPKVRSARSKRQYQERKEHVIASIRAALQKMGAPNDSFSVQSRYGYSFFDVDIDLEKQPITDEGLTHLASLGQLEDVQIKTLRLRETQVTDEGLRHLAKMSQLEFLDLSQTQVTGIGIPALPRLKKLWLLQASVDDEGLADVAKLSQLQTLDVRENYRGISDAGLSHLENLTNLKTLLINDRILNHDLNLNMKKLQQALPNCRIGEN